MVMAVPLGELNQHIKLAREKCSDSELHIATVTLLKTNPIEMTNTEKFSQSELISKMKSYVTDSKDVIKAFSEIKKKCKSDKKFTESLTSEAIKVRSREVLVSLALLIGDGEYEKAKKLLKDNIADISQSNDLNYSELLKRVESAEMRANPALSVNALDRMVHVGMQLGKKYRVNAKAFKSTNPDKIFIKALDFNPLVDNSSRSIAIISSLENLSSSQRGVIYDLNEQPACLEVAMMNHGNLIITNVEAGICK